MCDAELDSILEQRNLHALLQPIVNCRSGKVFGYEALIRGPSTGPLHSPVTLFDTAARCGRLTQLDLLCRQIAVRRFGQLQLPGRLFLNVTPAVVTEADFRGGETLRYLATAGLGPERIVIELTEQYPVQDYQVMRRAVQHYREMGFSIAIDDLGAGYSSLRLWSELRPDFVKIDRHFVQDVDQDPGKREFVRSILEMAKGLGTRVVAEGIETLEEYRCLWSMGLELAQGYFFARPTTFPPREVDSLLPQALSERGRTTNSLREAALSLAQPLPPAAASCTTEEVAAMFERTPTLRSVAVVDEASRPVGIVRRDDILGLFARHYGRALYSKRRITDLVRSEPLIAAHDMPLESLSQQITGHSGLTGDEDFIVLGPTGEYAGIGTVMELLRRITELQIRNARYANPLTGLPGNVPINEHLEALLQERVAFTVALCDIDHFKAYNDHHGYRRGDDVIARLAQQISDQAHPGRDFVGHVGGDDYVVIWRSQDWKRRCENILAEFAQSAPWFYDGEQRQRGGIDGTDRQGRVTFFPIMSLSIGALPVQPGSFQSPHEIAGLLTELKSQAKRRSGNSLFVDRREYSLPTPQPA